jgi:hypothetical protein
MSWKSIQTELGSSGFIDKLVMFSREQKDKIPASRMKKLSLITGKAEFTPEQISTVSSLCSVLAEWVLSVERYYLVQESCKVKTSEL